MEKPVPKIPLELIVGFYLGMGALLLWLSVSKVFAFLICVGIGALFVVPLSTRLSSAGISQLGWRGGRFLSWEEVKEAELERLHLRLAGSDLKITVMLVCFPDADAALEFVVAHLPSHVQRSLSNAST